jgi:LuxR family transcriptional regulator, maltose regulon positive regulatory protein
VAAPEIRFAVVASMAGALIARKPDHPRVSQWMHRTEELVYGELNPDLRLRAGIYVTTFNLWMGRYGTSGRIAETIRRIAASAEATPLTVISWKWVEAATETFCEMAPEKGLIAVEAGLEIARSSGVHMLDFMLYAQGVTAALSQGDLAAAKTFLGEMTKVVKGKNARSAFHFFSAWHACLAGNCTSGLSHAEQSLKDAIASGMPCAEALVQVAVADLLFIQGERRKAWEHLKIACRIAEPAQSSNLLFLIHLTTAWLLLSTGDGKDDPLPALRRALAIGRAQGLKNSYWWNSPRMTRLCLLALENGIETDYVRDLIRTRGLAPDAPPYGCAAWPWPLRIRTLGRFAIYRDEQEVRFPSKAPRQILLVLKGLVAAGPQGATEEHLADLLWPDAPGDAALKSLATSLHRLRQLLDTHEAIKLRDGRLTMNPNCCFVDAHAFELLVTQAEVNRSGAGDPGLSGRTGETDRLLERALSLYQGRFLEDVSAAWATSTRERLQARYVRAVLYKGSRLQAKGRLDDALICYEQGIEHAELAEPLHMRLITCLLEKGRRAEALMSHNRFAQLLSSSLGLGPSDEMRALLKRIRDDDLQPSSS